VPNDGCSTEAAAHLLMQVNHKRHEIVVARKFPHHDVIPGQIRMPKLWFSALLQHIGDENPFEYQRSTSLCSLPDRVNTHSFSFQGRIHILRSLSGYSTSTRSNDS
jgi:hypothetical protein